MATYRYRALDKRGEMVVGEITAPHEDEVMTQIEYLGLIPVDLENAAGKGSGLLAIFTRDYSLKDMFAGKAGAEDVTIFTRDLALLLRSGVRIDQALELLGDSEMSGALTPVVGKLRASVNAGETFADALGKHPDLFPEVYVSLARIGETSGSLAGVVESLAEERVRVSAMRRKAIDSLRYPAFILCAAFAVLMFFLVFVLPQFAVVLQDLGSKLDPIVAFMLSLSDFVRANGKALGAGAGALALAVVAAVRSRDGRAWMLRQFVKLPGLRAIAMDYRTAVFCRSLGVLLSNGVRLTAALNLVADAVANEGAAEKWEHARARVRQGARLGDALSETTELAPLAVRMLRLGEESGHLAPIAIRAADLFESRVERRLERLVAIIGPAAILLIAVVVGGLVVSLMTSLISIGQLAN